MTDRASRPKSPPSIRVVEHHPWLRGLILMSVVLLSLGGAVAGYLYGRATADIDVVRLTALERLDAANRQTISKLRAELVDAELARSVEREAARTLGQDIRTLKDQVAKLSEEVAFYKSLMAPSSIAKGLQIADFELSEGDAPGRYVFHLLLTQIASRRDWVQGEASLEVVGRMPVAGAGADGHVTGGDNGTTDTGLRVLPLTEIAVEGSYPLAFRFRYFQDLTGMIELPDNFQPVRVVVTARQRGAGTEPLNRTFDWQVSG